VLKYSYLPVLAGLIFVFISAANFTHISSQGPTVIKDNTESKNDSNMKVEVASRGLLNFPTSMAFLGPNDILVAEKNTGIVKRVINGTVLSEPLLDLNVANKNERGLLGIAVAKDIKSNKIHEGLEYSNTTYVFLYYTESKNKDGDDVTGGKEALGNRLYRYELSGNKLLNSKLLLDLPITSSAVHNGGKITIGPDGNIYLIVGNINNDDSKTENIKAGKEPYGTAGILRVDQDGKGVSSILGDTGNLSKYYAYGIRNSFGLAFDPITGDLWDTENGPGFGDEINLIKPGFNSGWQKAQGAWRNINETMGGLFNQETELTNFNGRGQYSAPRFSWNETVGVTDLTFLNSDKLGKKFENDLFVADF